MQKPVFTRTINNINQPSQSCYSAVRYGCQSRCGEVGQTIVSKAGLGRFCDMGVCVYLRASSSFYFSVCSLSDWLSSFRWAMLTYICVCPLCGRCRRLQLFWQISCCRRAPGFPPCISGTEQLLSPHTHFQRAVAHYHDRPSTCSKTVHTAHRARFDPTHPGYHGYLITSQSRHTGLYGT